jgi:hypothetical protein
MLYDSFRQLWRSVGAGVDGVDYAEYEKDLNANPCDLPEHLKTQRYRAKLIRRRFYATLLTQHLRWRKYPTITGASASSLLAQVHHHC